MPSNNSSFLNTFKPLKIDSAVILWVEFQKLFIGQKFNQLPEVNLMEPHCEQDICISSYLHGTLEAQLQVSDSGISLHGHCVLFDIRSTDDDQREVYRIRWAYAGLFVPIDEVADRDISMDAFLIRGRRVHSRFIILHRQLFTCGKVMTRRTHIVKRIIDLTRR